MSGPAATPSTMPMTPAPASRLAASGCTPGMVKQRDGHRDQPDDDGAEALQDGQLGPDLPGFEVVDILGEAAQDHILAHERQATPGTSRMPMMPMKMTRPAHHVGGFLRHEDRRDQDRRRARTAGASALRVR